MSALVEKYKDFMANFEKGQLIGLDIGLSSIKVAYMSKPKKNVFRLENYYSIPLAEAAIIEDEIQKPEDIIQGIEECITKSGISKKIVCIGMDGPNTMTKRLKVPDGAKEEVEDNILWESEQYIPFGADDAEIAFDVIGKIEEEDVVDAVVAAVRTDVSERYTEYVKEAGFIPKVVDLNVFAITNLFEYTYSDRIEELGEEGSIIIDFGAQTTTIIVYKNNGPVLTKEINIGGVLVTEEIQRTMGVSYTEAEDLKVNGDEQGNLPEEIIHIVEGHTQKILEELKKILNFYIAAGSNEKVGFCFITGGSSKLPGILEAIQNLVDLDVEEINPFDQIEVKGRFSNEVLDEIATSGFVALGLAMRKTS